MWKNREQFAADVAVTNKEIALLQREIAKQEAIHAKAVAKYRAVVASVAREVVEEAEATDFEGVDLGASQRYGSWQGTDHPIRVEFPMSNAQFKRIEKAGRAAPGWGNHATWRVESRLLRILIGGTAMSTVGGGRLGERIEDEVERFQRDTEHCLTESVGKVRVSVPVRYVRVTDRAVDAHQQRKQEMAERKAARP